MNVDINGRVFDDTIFYCNREEIALINEYSLRNHLYKCRQDHKIAKGGVYCTPPELFYIDGIREQAHLLNINFRNVQYIKNNQTLYWIYVLPISNLYSFNFVGRNMTQGVLKVIMDNSNYFLAFQREVDDITIQVWYNPDTMYILAVQLRHKQIFSKNIYYRKFERDVVCTSYTTLYKETAYKNNIPLCDQYTNWTDIINVMTDQEREERKLNLSVPRLALETAKHPELLDNYNEMLRVLFNK